MKRSLLYPTSIALASVLAACAEQPVSSITAADDTTQPLFLTSECGGRTDMLDSRVALDFTFTGSTGIQGDGSGTYNTLLESGVGGKIFYYDGGCSRSGDMTFSLDPKSQRRLTYYFPAGNDAKLPTGGITGTGGVNFRALMQLGSDVNKDGAVTSGRDSLIEAKSPGADRAKEYPDWSALRGTYPTFNGRTPVKFRFASTRVAGCEELEYEMIELERNTGTFNKTSGTAADGITPLGKWERTGGTWTVRSIETVIDGKSGHWARCYALVSGKLKANGSLMNMPFAVNVTEILR